MVGLPDSDLVITGFGVEADEVKAAAGSVAKVVEGIVAAGNRVEVRFGDGVELAVVDAEAPDEVLDGVDVFLVGLGCKEGFREPATAVSPVDVTVVEEVVDVFLQDGAFVNAVVTLAASDGRRRAGFDAELKA